MTDDDALAERLAELEAIPVWDTRKLSKEMGGPRAVAHVWRWDLLRPEFSAAIKTKLAGPGTERRVILLHNPGLPKSYAAATHTLNGALQMILPGEIAPAHRHSYAALRFVLEGSGAFTVVNGVRVDMDPFDLLLTPAMFWHSHTHVGTEPMVWFDGLDTPFVTYMQADAFELHDSRSLEPHNESAREAHDFGNTGMLAGRQRTMSANSPQLIYKWSVARVSIERAISAGSIDPFDGAVFEYVNPHTGGHVMPTMACYAQGFASGFHSLARRRTSSSVCVVVKGRGATIIDGKRYEWTEKDVIAEPASAWCEYVAYEPSMMFRLSDQPLLEPFGLLRVEDHPDGRQSS
jgi:gentisate 1,2-dioxygenase